MNEELEGFEELDEFEFEPKGSPEEPEDISQEYPKQDEFINSLLKSKGIDDITKIKFEDDDGSIQERNWNDLSIEEKLKIVNFVEQPEDGLDDDEIKLINTIRESSLTPSEYLEQIQKQSVDNYIHNSQDQNTYEIDQLSDDELFIYDLMDRTKVTEEEAQELLEQAKTNKDIYSKQITAIRNEYKALENESKRQAQLEFEEQQQERYNQFVDQITDEVESLNEFSGYDLNLDDEDKSTLLNFITGFDGAGNNYFAKVLSDPKMLVQAAWLTLNGQQMLEDITTYFQNEIKQVRKESYQKGLEDSKNKSSVVFKDKSIKDSNNIYSDLDDF